MPPDSSRPVGHPNDLPNEKRGVTANGNEWTRTKTGGLKVRLRKPTHVTANGGDLAPAS